MDWGGPLKARATPLAVDKHQHNGNAALVATEIGEKQECGAGGDKGREGPGITGRWRLKSHGRTSVCSASQTLYTIVEMHPFRCVQIVSFVKSGRVHLVRLKKYSWHCSVNGKQTMQMTLIIFNHFDS